MFAGSLYGNSTYPNPQNLQTPTPAWGIPCFRESHGNPKSVHVHWILCHFCMILQQAFPTCGSRGISQFTWFSHVGGLFLVAVNMGIPCEQHKSVQTARNMGNPCKRMTISQQHGIHILSTSAWAQQHLLAM